MLQFMSFCVSHPLRIIVAIIYFSTVIHQLLYNGYVVTAPQIAVSEYSQTYYVLTFTSVFSVFQLLLSCFSFRLEELLSAFLVRQIQWQCILSTLFVWEIVYHPIIKNNFVTERVISWQFVFFQHFAISYTLHLPAKFLVRNLLKAF